jgi:hypothetical protein
MAVKVRIENAVLRGSHDMLQKVATVYLDGGDEYYVYAPSRATGNALEWLEHLSVHQLSRDSFSFGGEVTIRDSDRCERIMFALTEELAKYELDADIWRPGVNDDGRFHAAQICLKGHVQSASGRDFKRGEHCPHCGNVCIDSCRHCKAAIRGNGTQETLHYKRPSFCHSCGRPYPWMEDRQQTARELLYHDDKLLLEDREKLWDLLQDVMSDPKSDLAPAKKHLIGIYLDRAASATREVMTDLLAKYLAELSKP